MLAVSKINNVYRKLTKLLFGGWQHERDVIVAINDVAVRNKNGNELAALIHNGTGWYSGLEGISTLTLRRQTSPQKLMTVVVTHLDADVRAPPVEHATVTLLLHV